MAPRPDPHPARQADPLVAALVRYVEALDACYPDGPEQMRRERLDARGNIARTCKVRRGTAA